MPVLTDDMGVAGLTVNHDDFRVLPAGVEERVDENVTKPQGQALLRVGVEILIMKEDDAVVQERLTDLSDSRVAEIGAQAGKSRELIGEVTVGSQGQVQTISEMTEAVTILDRATQSTAASAEQSSANAAEVLGMADDMRKVADALGELVGEKG